MGGGGSFFQNPIQAIGNANSGSVKAIEQLAQGQVSKSFRTATNAGASSMGIKQPFEQEKKPQVASVQAQANASGPVDSAAQIRTPATEGGTPTAVMANTAKEAGSAAALSGSQQAVNQSAGSGTLLTGNEGIDPQSLELGRKTLLGG